VLAEMPMVDPGKCNGCGLCVSVCRYNVLVMVDNVVTVVQTQECDWCTLCEAVCPTQAISCPFEIVVEQP
jgi:MinD superfamily P-loop ATPase